MVTPCEFCRIRKQHLMRAVEINPVSDPCLEPILMNTSMNFTPEPLISQVSLQECVEDEQAPNAVSAFWQGDV